MIERLNSGSGRKTVRAAAALGFGALSVLGGATVAEARAEDSVGVDCPAKDLNGAYRDGRIYTFSGNETVRLIAGVVPEGADFVEAERSRWKDEIFPQQVVANGVGKGCVGLAVEKASVCGKTLQLDTVSPSVEVGDKIYHEDAENAYLNTYGGGFVEVDCQDNKAVPVSSGEEISRKQANSSKEGDLPTTGWDPTMWVAVGLMGVGAGGGILEYRHRAKTR